MNRGVESRSDKFQSTRPLRAATADFQAALDAHMISIHAALAGRDEPLLRVELT